MDAINGIMSFISWINILLLLKFVAFTDCYYELSATDRDVCSSGTQFNTTIDLVCHIQGQSRSGCVATDIQWFRTSGVNTYEITTSSKYGIWESIEGFGADRHQRVALLRIRNFQLSDIARYSCHVTCDFGSGLKKLVQFHTDVCLEEPHVKGLQCPVLVEEHSCSYNFKNGRCDHQCDIREHLYDGFDCAVDVPECAHDKCTPRYADGTCNEQCNTPECQWDGGDCTYTALDLAQDHILIKVERPVSNTEQARPPTHRELKYRLLARDLSRVSRSLLRIVQEPPNEGYIAPEMHEDHGFMSHDFLDSHKAYDNVVLKLDNTNCEKRCLQYVNHVAQFLELSNTGDASSAVNVHAITVLRQSPQMCRSSNTSLLHLESTDTASNYNPIIPEKSHLDSADEEPPDWDLNVVIIVLCVLGTLVILGLLVAIFGVIMCIKNDQQHLRVDKNKIQSPFHKDNKTWNKPVDV